MREIHSPTGLHYQLHETPEDLAALTTVVSRQHSVSLDTELADWNTRTPRLSLIQLRPEDGSIHVVDVLSPEMAAAYEAIFVPAVIEAPHVHKWAHYARFERRVFGPDRTRSLHCTFDLARGVPYHRLPLRSLRLAALVRHLHGTSIDKSFQRADWGSSARTWRARRRSRAGACATSPWSYTGNQTESPEEAGAIAALVQSLVEGEAWWTDRDGKRQRVGLDDILIVAAYNAQVAEIARRLPKGVRVGTVDKFQGQEAPVSIYSMATSSPADAPRGMAFLDSLNRLNVATSRARCLSALVASPELFRVRCRTPRQMQLASALCRLLEMAKLSSISHRT